jgi:hypothetical protein
VVEVSISAQVVKVMEAEAGLLVVTCMVFLFWKFCVGKADLSLRVPPQLKTRRSTMIAGVKETNPERSRRWRWCLREVFMGAGDCCRVWNFDKDEDSEGYGGQREVDKETYTFKCQ